MWKPGSKITKNTFFTTGVGQVDIMATFYKDIVFFSRDQITKLYVIND